MRLIWRKGGLLGLRIRKVLIAGVSKDGGKAFVEAEGLS